MSYDLTTLENGCQELEIQLNGQQKEQFIKFYEYGAFDSLIANAKLLVREIGKLMKEE